MKILLTAINAKYIHSNLAVYSLRAYAEEYRGNIELAEFTINHQKEYILSEIYKKKPDVLCFSCYIWNISYVREIAAEFHSLCPDVPIWVGGPEVSYEAEDFLQENPYITGIMVGEGEKIFTGLCRYYCKGQGTFDEIRGIAWRRGGQIVVNPPETVLDLSSIPFAYEDMKDFQNKIIYYETSRGCPFRCSYCLSSVDKQLRFRDLALVKKELGFFLEQKVPQVKFVDRTFNCKKEHAMAIWQYIKEHDNGITNFHFEIAADLLTEDEIDLLATMRPGLVQLEIGVQTTNDATIAEIHRHMDLVQVKRLVERVKKPHNIHQHLDLIAGLPYEDFATFARSFDEIYALHPDQLQLGFLKVLKGSYMYEHATEYELVYAPLPPYEVRRTKWLSYDEVLQIKQVEEMLEVHYNSAQFPVSIRLLEAVFDSAFEMFLQLGRYYEEHGYFQMSHSRNRRMEIFLDFVKQVDGMHLMQYQEAALYDIYSRENAKSRPSFATEDNDTKKLSRLFCKKGKLSHFECFWYELPFSEKSTVSRERKKQPYYLYFDYEKRSPLDHTAAVTRYEESDIEKVRSYGNDKTDKRNS